ncbi:hypothetical protein LX32DRAFT_635223 [Colletotrichum zoysiae]|uniref:Uncharacterized protein n=1 Tax=Colletotrichum zoysiae TaxID=1216348 RepID=A0AAD9M8H6_9PEZI|nr:hypothetical protein LX32DRAFT_635223 [Colletotrichum zoysiae]
MYNTKIAYAMAKWCDAMEAVPAEQSNASKRNYMMAAKNYVGLGHSCVAAVPKHGQ